MCCFTFLSPLRKAKVENIMGYEEEKEKLKSHGGGSKDQISPGVVGSTLAIHLTHFVGYVVARENTRMENQDQDLP